MEVKYKLIVKENLSSKDISNFGDALKEQNEVHGNPYSKAEKCTCICFAIADDEIIGIGGIKDGFKESVFKKAHQELCKNSMLYKYELGYIYSKIEGEGVASTITKKLISKMKNEKLYATTRLHTNIGMVKILRKNGFIHTGKTWESVKTIGDEIGLFLKKN